MPSPPPTPVIGTLELEKGMRASHAREVPVIAGLAVALLLVFNAGGLAKWTESLPSNPTSLWIAERANEWSDLMTRLGPARVFEDLRRRWRRD